MIANFSFTGIFFVCVCACCRYFHKSLLTNEVFVSRIAERSVAGTEDFFKSGLWSMRYLQNEEWHESNRFTIWFNHETLTMTGIGNDYIGTFTVDGVFSSVSNRMGLSKKYQEGTGDPKENFGQTVTIQVTLNSRRTQFEGKWYVVDPGYDEREPIELKLEQAFSIVERKSNP